MLHQPSELTQELLDLAPAGLDSTGLVAGMQTLLAIVEHATPVMSYMLTHARRSRKLWVFLHCTADLSVEFDTLLANSQRTLMANLAADMERRAVAAHEATGNEAMVLAHGGLGSFPNHATPAETGLALNGVISHQMLPERSAEVALLRTTFADARINALRSQLDRLEEEKADITLVTQYTGQVRCFVSHDGACIAEMGTQASLLDALPGCSSHCQHDVDALLRPLPHCGSWVQDHTGASAAHVTSWSTVRQLGCQRSHSAQLAFTT